MWGRWEYPAERGNMDYAKTIELFTAANEVEADLVIGYLGEHQIKAMVWKENAESYMESAFGKLDRTVRVRVYEENLEEAKKLLDEFLSAQSDLEEDTPESKVEIQKEEESGKSNGIRTIAFLVAFVVVAGVAALLISSII